MGRMDMANIKRTSRIDETRLRGTAYLQSLLTEGVRAGILTETDAEHAQFGCIELLAAQIELENRGYSSSVPEETAQRMMSSIVYTVGLGLKAYPCADDAAEALKTTRMNVLYAQGGAQIAKLLRETRALYKTALQTRIETPNAFYLTTLDSSFQAFFRRYDPEFAADESNFLPEYALLFSVQDRIGVEFAHTYAQRLCWENRFCCQFPPEELQELFAAGAASQDDPSVNLFRCVLTAALGNQILKGAHSTLRLTEQDVRDLYDLLQDKLPGDVERQAIDAFPLPPDAEDIFRQYILDGLHTIVEALFRSLAQGLPRFRAQFLAPVPSPEAPTSVFRAEERMPNEQYRTLLESLAQAKNIAERIRLVRTQVTSLGDLTDLLTDELWSEEELHALFQTLDDLSIAVLEKHAAQEAEHSIAERAETYLPCLRVWIASLPAERQRAINAISSGIKVEPF